LIQAGGEILAFEVNKVINSILNKEELPGQRKILLMYQFTRIAINLPVIIIARYHSYQLHTKLYRISIDEIIADRQCGFRRNRSATDQIFCISLILEKKWDYNETVHQLFIDFKKADDSVRREVLYNILIELGVPMKLDRLIKMCLNKTHSKVCRGKHFF
jgi:hypothetical protein